MDNTLQPTQYEPTPNMLRENESEAKSSTASFKRKPRGTQARHISANQPPHLQIPWQARLSLNKSLPVKFEAKLSQITENQTKAQPTLNKKPSTQRRTPYKNYLTNCDLYFLEIFTLPI